MSAQPGERVTLSLGELVLGSGPASASMTSIDLDPPSTPLRAGNRATNVARLLHSLGTDPDLVAGITVTDAHRAAAGRFAGRIDFDLPPEAFAIHPSVRGLAGALGVELRSEHCARNHPRRSVHGIKKRSDIPVPLRDGSALLADVFLTSVGRPMPAVLRLGPYGRAFGFGPLGTDEERQRSEAWETAWFEDHSTGAGTAAYGENLTSVDAFSWVPRGYAVVRVDERGTGGTHGPLLPFSQQEALDYYDTIEWVAAQDWCTGAVGLAAASYGATIQWNVARLRPPSLRAMIPWAGDTDSYRELAYPGGILHEGYRTWWWGAVTSNVTPGEVAPDFVQALREHPFYDENFYGPDGNGPISAVLDDIDLPFLTAVSQNATLHSRGGFEAFRQCPSSDKQLLVVDSHYYPFFFEWCLDDLVAFFDRWLKDDAPELVERPRVRYALLTGHGEFTWREATTWPPLGTEHLVLHLDAPTGAARREDAMSTYAADDQDPTRSGISFLTPPFEANVLLVGNIAAHLALSSSSHDADVFGSVDVVDTDGRPISFHVGGNPRTPITSGSGSCSRRKRPSPVTGGSEDRARYLPKTAPSCRRSIKTRWCAALRALSIPDAACRRSSDRRYPPLRCKKSASTRTSAPEHRAECADRAPEGNEFVALVDGRTGIHSGTRLRTGGGDELIHIAEIHQVAQVE
jgi:predicted acyl esterase